MNLTSVMMAANTSLETSRVYLNPKSRSIRVMVVDDREEVRESLETYLSLCDDIEVVAEAGDGLEAVEVARATRPDIILMDVAMPLSGGREFDGLDACREIKREGISSAVIALTIHADYATRRRADQAGCSCFLEKGISPSEIVQQVRELGCYAQAC